MVSLTWPERKVFAWSSVSVVLDSVFSVCVLESLSSLGSLTKLLSFHRLRPGSTRPPSWVFAATLLLRPREDKGSDQRGAEYLARTDEGWEAAGPWGGPELGTGSPTTRTAMCCLCNCGRIPGPLWPSDAADFPEGGVGGGEEREPPVVKMKPCAEAEMQRQWDK